MRFISRFINQLLARWKWVLSFRKLTWDLDDYPISLRSQKPGDSPYDNNPRFKMHGYRASIVNWLIDGTGNSKQEALENLQQNFLKRKTFLAEDGKPLPRPGTRVPISFTSQERVNAHRELAEDFIQQILGLDWAWISDGSSLWDFHTESTNDSLLSKIRALYGVDVADIESARLCEIFDRIAEARKLST